MTTVRAKFTCQHVVPLEQGPGAAVLVRFHAVYGDGTDNASWSKATPSGVLEMTITNPTAADAFVAGQDYYLDFTPVADIDLGTIPGVTVVDSEAEVDQPGGPAEQWKRAARVGAPDAAPAAAAN